MTMMMGASPAKLSIRRACEFISTETPIGQVCQLGHLRRQGRELVVAEVKCRPNFPRRLFDEFENLFGVGHGILFR